MIVGVLILEIKKNSFTKWRARKLKSYRLLRRRENIIPFVHKLQDVKYSE